MTKPGGGLAYRIEGCLIRPATGKSLSPASCTKAVRSPSRLTKPWLPWEGNGQARTDKAEATDFLRDILANGPLPANQVKAEATEAGITPKSLRSAREASGIKPEKSGFEGGGYGHSRRCPSRPKMPASRSGLFRIFWASSAALSRALGIVLSKPAVVYKLGAAAGVFIHYHVHPMAKPKETHSPIRGRSCRRNLASGLSWRCERAGELQSNASRTSAH